MQIEEKFQGRFFNRDIHAYTISNGLIHLSVSTLGCTITSIIIPGKNDQERNIVLGYDSSSGYLDDPYYMGCTVGRFAGRISNASFEIDGTVFKLAQNDPGTLNHLHGGFAGFNKKIFRLVSETNDEKAASLQFYYGSADMDEGYPGNLDLWITYKLTRDNEIIIQYRAVTDKKTHINITNHSYFNFSGLREPAIGHELCINADSFVFTDGNYIPNGAIIPVAQTVYDFRKRRKIDLFFNQLPSGYNECFVLNKTIPGDAVNAILYDQYSGISMGISTSLPGIVLYTGDFLKNEFVKNQGICLETQFFPDTPNHHQFPSTLLSPGQEYFHHTVLAFNQLT